MKDSSLLLLAAAEEWRRRPDFFLTTELSLPALTSVCHAILLAVREQHADQDEYLPAESTVRRWVERLRENGCKHTADLIESGWSHDG